MSLLEAAPISTAENLFGGYAKTRLAKFRGMSKQHFEIHLKECEFRFNYQKENLYKLLLKICREKPLN